MRVCVVGTGYVGLVTGACLAEIGHVVTCVDSDEQKIKKLLGHLRAPFHEPGLNEIIQQTATTRTGTSRYGEECYLNFTSSMEAALERNPEVIFLCVGTPLGEEGDLDRSQLEGALSEIAENLRTDAQIVIKSTVGPGTAKWARDVLQRSYPHFNTAIGWIVSNPEFLKEGHAVEDFRRPDRIVVGALRDESLAVMRDLYSHFIRNGHTYLEMSNESAELTKLAANAMLATRISFMNETAMICEQVGADVMDVRKGIGSDSRIGMSFLYPGIGFGGSCFPKDVAQVANLPSSPGGRYPFLVRATLEVNKLARHEFCEKIMNSLRDKSHLGGAPKVAIWGLSFKPKTDDVREAPALDIITTLLTSYPELDVRIYDPIVEDLRLPDETSQGVKLTILDRARASIFPNKYEALKGAHALVLCTEWAEFRKPDWDLVHQLMAERRIFDGRNQWSPEELIGKGFKYSGVGRST